MLQDVTAAKMFTEEAEAMFERSTSILKQNMLLHFAFADFEESHLKYEKVHQIYNDYLDQKQIDPTLVGTAFHSSPLFACVLKSTEAKTALADVFLRNCSKFFPKFFKIFTKFPRIVFPET